MWARNYDRSYAQIIFYASIAQIIYKFIFSLSLFLLVLYSFYARTARNFTLNFFSLRLSGASLFPSNLALSDHYLLSYLWKQESIISRKLIILLRHPVKGRDLRALWTDQI